MKTKNEVLESKKGTRCAVIRIKQETKTKLIKVKDSINKEEGVNIKDDTIIRFLLDLVTDEHIKLLQTSNLTWSSEEARIRTIWSKKNGKTSSEKWKELLFTGALADFIQEHSRIKFGADRKRK